MNGKRKDGGMVRNGGRKGRGEVRRREGGREGGREREMKEVSS